jgi:hypothetical protein
MSGQALIFARGEPDQDAAQGKLTCGDLTGTATRKVVVAPFMLTELVRGIVKGGV